MSEAKACVYEDNSGNQVVFSNQAKLLQFYNAYRLVKVMGLVRDAYDDLERLRVVGRLCGQNLTFVDGIKPSAAQRRVVLES